MSPGAALQSDVFRLYFFIIAGIIAVTGALLAIQSWVLKKDVSSVWKIYKSWLVMVPLVLGIIFAGRLAAVIFFTLVAMMGLKEYARATGLYRDWWFTATLYLGVMAAGLICLIPDPTTGSPGWFGLFMTLPVYEIAALLMIPILRNRAQGQLQVLALSILGFIYMGWMFSHLAFLTNARQAYGYLLYLIFAVEINDVAAYLFGKLLGRHQLRSQISPNKTWEGSLGALGISLMMPWLLHFSFPHFGPVQLLLTGLIIGVGGQLGDLSLSVIKRDLGIKDMGVRIPGHGGVLDRVDSLIYTAPLFLHMVRYFYDLY